MYLREKGARVRAGVGNESAGRPATAAQSAVLHAAAVRRLRRWRRRRAAAAQARAQTAAHPGIWCISLMASSSA